VVTLWACQEQKDSETCDSVPTNPFPQGERRHTTPGSRCLVHATFVCRANDGHSPPLSCLLTAWDFQYRMADAMFWAGIEIFFGFVAGALILLLALSLFYACWAALLAFWQAVRALSWSSISKNRLVLTVCRAALATICFFTVIYLVVVR
jgi:hypothetical protein